MAERTEQQIQRNNDIFKEANERIRTAADRLEHRLDRIPFLCECPMERCVEVVRLTEEEYAGVRADPDHYFTVAGHEDAEKPLGQVVERYDGYVIVAK